MASMILQENSFIERWNAREKVTEKNKNGIGIVFGCGSTKFCVATESG